MNPLEKAALKAMQVDPLAKAEQLVGVGSESIAALGIGIAQQMQKEKEDLFSVLGDTHFNITFQALSELLATRGFEKHYTERHGDRADVFEIWWHPNDNLLLTAESYSYEYGTNRPKLNSVQVYYNWAPAENLPRETAYQYLSSGGFVQAADGRASWIWSGYYDGREGLFTHLKQLRENGQFLSPWVEQPFLWLLSYSETHVKEYDYKAINARKLSALPAYVRAAILA